MTTETKIHKAGPQKVSVYAGFGHYDRIPAPLCVGAKAVYDGKSFLVHRLKKYVTCKHCLKKLHDKDHPSILEVCESTKAGLTQENEDE